MFSRFLILFPLRSCQKDDENVVQDAIIMIISNDDNDITLLVVV